MEIKKRLIHYIKENYLEIPKTLNYGTAGFRDIYNEKFKFLSVLTLLFISKLSSNKQKTLGFMLTASHNPHQYNGIKVANYDGELLEQESEKELENFVHLDLKSLLHIIENTLPINNPTIAIGYDTRESSETIIKELMYFSHLLQIKIINVGVSTTPQLFRAVREINENNNDYLQIYTDILINSYQCKLKSIKNNNRNIFIDHANGSGTAIFTSHFESKLNEILNINAKICTPKGEINENCGSDFVTSKNIIPPFMNSFLANSEENLGVSFDGDCDRIVFYNNNQIYDGDYIALLLMKYISEIEKDPKFKSLSKSIVVTPYSNNNMKKVVEECGWEFILSAPGVKNLHREAIKSDISIYFEKNGHGNIHFSEDALKLKNLYEIDKLLYSKAGDSIALFILTIFALNYLKMTTTDFTNLLENTIQVNDKIIRTNLNVKLLTNEIETEIISPTDLADGIKKVNEKFPNNRSVIRPSGTEPIIRLLVEGNNNLEIEQHINELKEYFNGKV